METDQPDVSNASEGTASVGGNPAVGRVVSYDCEAKEDCLLSPLSDNHIYRQDVVRRNGESLLGVVTKVAGDSDSNSDSDSGSESDLSDDDDDVEDLDEGDPEDEEDVEEKEKDVNVENKGESTARKTGAVGSNDDNDDRHSLATDHVRVLWMDDSETTHHRNELTVVDRGFVHGDYVASSLDPSGQIGLIVDVNMTVDLLSPDDSIIKDVSSRDLKRVRVITVGDYVVSGPWLGRVDVVLDDVTLLFPDGSVCKIDKAEPSQLLPIANNFLEGHCLYHPGQRVEATSLSVLKGGQLVSGQMRANQLEATVIKVTVGSVYVHWIASAGYGPESVNSPSEKQNPNNLKLLSCFSHANWQLGDWCFLPSQTLFLSTPLENRLSKLRLHETEEAMDLDSVDGTTPTDVSSKLKDDIPETSHIKSKKPLKILVKRGKKPRKKERTYKKALLIVNTRAKVNVAWQDGTLEQGLDSTSLIPIESPGDHDFVAEQYVIEKAVDDNDDDDEDTSETRRVGVIKRVDAKEKTACVNWLKQVAKPEDPREYEKEEIVSVYELEGHPDYDYCYGDVVVRLSPAVFVPTVDFGENNMNSNASDGVKDDSILDSNAIEGASGEEACSEFSYLSWVGNITGLRNGDIEVTWADGMVSTVGPQAIYVVGRDDDDSIAGGSDTSSWETLEDNEMDVLDDSNKVQTPGSTENNPGSEEDTTVRENSSGSIGAFGFALEIFRMASEIFSRAHSDGDSETSGETELQSEEEIHISDGIASSNASNTQDPSVIDVSDGYTNTDKNEKMLDSEACSGGNLCSFKRFDTAKDPLDHFFLGAIIRSNSERKWLKKVQRDWTILQNNLPDGIYVRVYEDRMDLLRAVIVGAYGTPYQDGLFFFDFHLPPEYPDVPPSAHYHSGGWRINPNLYEEGKVCLSLLNTWTGRGNEVWDPQSSSILQVLVSLQGLILNSKPYFNEAGYDKQVGTTEGEKNSLSYNENTFLLNCKTIMYLIRKPPKDFEDLVEEHFKQRGYYILKACDAYMRGYLIGTLAKDALVTSKSEANATSVGFKLMLAKIAPKLIASFNKVGADCHEFEHLQES